MDERPELRIAPEYGLEDEPPRDDYAPGQEPYDYKITAIHFGVEHNG
jgi:hypothetical protein